MIRNQICPYCSTVMVEAENLPNAKSVEHLIPNKALRYPRSKRDGDFFACRKCNCKKGHIDYVLAVVAKGQSSDDQLAVKAMIEAIEKEEKSAERFIQMIATAKETNQGAEMRMPFIGRELLDYISFLGRGQHFRATGKLFDERTQVMIVGFYNKEVMRFVEGEYQVKHNSSPFEDLTENKFSETYSQGDCIIYSKNTSYLFLLHNYTAISIKVRRRNPKNLLRSEESARRILDDFGWDTKFHSGLFQSRPNAI